MNLANYRAPCPQNWHGRFDGQAAERFFQVVELIDLNTTPSLLPQAACSIALIGFSCDVGIKRNLGRVGAALGPEEFRKYFGNLALPVESKLSLYDLGDIICVDEDLEAAQQSLSFVVKWACDMKLIPIVIGGGHEVSLGAYVGAAHSVPGNIGIINFDAHFDLRPYKLAGANSGSSFLQIADWCHEQGRSFGYLVLGLQPAANTISLFDQASKLQAKWLTAERIANNLSDCQSHLEKFVAAHQQLYMTLCLDVFAHAVAPGVSAPQPLGLWPTHVLSLMEPIIKSRKFICFDVAEYSPPLDDQGRTGRLCASMVYAIISALVDFN